MSSKTGPPPADLIVPEAFARGIRDLGYRSNGASIAEFVDNAIQAGARRVDLLFDYDPNGSARRPTRLAVIDDGKGMVADMIRLAVRWGGTDRENNRAGLGRYGFGLPCAAVSLGRRFTVYSRTKDGPLHALTIDLDELATGAYRDKRGHISIPSAALAELPSFIARHIVDARHGRWRSGTVILIDKVDRLQWITSKRLSDALALQLGVTYHKLLTRTALYIDGHRVEPIDPLFLTEGHRFHDLDDDRARALEPVDIAVTEPGTNRKVGTIRLRYAWFPPSFGSVAKDREAIGVNANQRFPVIKSYHGLLFSRNGRLIDVQARTPWTTFINNDRYIKVEVEFSAKLDEHFGVTTSKQQITVSPFVWDLLQQAGVPKAIEQLRNKLREAKIARRVQWLVASLDAPLAGSAEFTEQGQLALRPAGHRLAFDHVRNAPFFKVARDEGPVTLYLNTAHAFFDIIYDSPRCSDEMRIALELMLLTAAGRDPAMDLASWSQRLEGALRELANNPQESSREDLRQLARESRFCDNAARAARERPD